MHFLLLGATGRTGRYVLSQLLSQGHTAVALVRNPASLSAQPGLTVVTGSPLSRDDIKAAVTTSSTQTISGAIVTLNTVRKTESPFAAPLGPPRLLADSSANVCAVLTEVGVKRIVIMSTAGVGDSWQNLPMLSRAFMGWTNVKYALEDHALVDEEVRGTDMDWTLVRGTRLVFDETEGNEGGSGQAEVETLGSAGVGMSMKDRLSVANAARFLVKVAVEGKFVKEAVVIRN